MKKAFTLAEVMIVLTVIGILTAILLPVARQSMPNENVLKFKKAHNTLGNVIRELVTSDKYYSNGDLGVMANGNTVSSKSYFCQTFADVVNAKKVACSTSNVGLSAHVCMCWLHTASYTDATLRDIFDTGCKESASKVKEEIVTTDGIVFYGADPNWYFGRGEFYQKFSPPSGSYNVLTGSYEVYKTFCIDVDGIPSNATKDNCVNECPFGYGIRVDGKIFNGARANEWLNKSAQGE